MRKKNPDITNQNVYMPHLNLIPNRLMVKTNYNNLEAVYYYATASILLKFNLSMVHCLAKSFIALFLDSFK